jgi:3-hydroxyacyl-CoA dehydrogenase / enoyl-CoA hydratase / 3-hydroxybutyryl-CoA epimerase
MVNLSVENSIGIIKLGEANGPMNVISESFLEALAREVDRTFKTPSLIGLVITSDKKEFLAGADLEMILKLKSADESLRLTGKLHKLFRSLETWGKPVVAAINGTALGGGFELCLAAHYRVALESPHIQLGLPEVKLGLLPGGGGTQRLARLIGFQAAMPFLLEGRAVNAIKAKEAGLINEVVGDSSSLLSAAKNWIKANPSPKQPWDDPKFRIPGGDVQSPKGYQVFPASSAMMVEKTHNNYPAPKAVLSCLYEGLQLPFERGLEIEQKYFAQLTQTKEARNLIRTTFFGINECNKGVDRPKEISPREVRKLAVLGAGMMGSGIAYVSAVAGIPVILKDVSKEAAERGKNYSVKLLQAQVEKGRMTESEMKTILNRIETTSEVSSLQGADLIIEAVIEDRKLKARVTKESEAVMDATGVFASNTSTLPISGLAKESTRPTRFIGLHFFSPVDKMPLVEIILGKESGPEALAFCFDYLKKIKKTPIVVRDGRGFYTSRVFTSYVSEGITCLTEGIHPALIENAGKKAGMPVGPLAVADEVSLDLVYHIYKQTIEDLGPQSVNQSTFKLADEFVNKHGRLGRKSGKGFYDYPTDGAKALWPDLAKMYKTLPTQPSLETVVRRLLTIQALETARVFEEKILTNARDGDVGSILGWGFPAYTGGTLSYIEWRGVDQFITDCQELAAQHGPRFQPTPTLLKMKEKNIKSFYEIT